jgi:hypothetical protein
MIEKIKEEKVWHVKCKLIHDYHKAMKEKHVDKRNYKWREFDSACQLGISVGYISESLRLYDAIEKNPLLKSLSREQALKLLRSKHER